MSQGGTVCRQRSQITRIEQGKGWKACGKVAPSAVANWVFFAYLSVCLCCLSVCLTDWLTDWSVCLSNLMSVFLFLSLSLSVSLFFFSCGFVVVCLFVSLLVYRLFLFDPPSLFTILSFKLLSFSDCDFGRCFEKRSRPFLRLVVTHYGKCDTWSKDVRKKLKCFLKRAPKKCMSTLVSEKISTLTI